MGITITPSGQACGASITGVDLSQPLSDEQTAEIRAAWLEHKVLSFSLISL
jgi:taurine dioxygenase